MAVPGPLKQGPSFTPERDSDKSYQVLAPNFCGHWFSLIESTNKVNRNAETLDTSEEQRVEFSDGSSNWTYARTEEIQYKAQEGTFPAE